MVNAVGKLHKKIRQIPGYGLASCRNQKGCIHTMSKPKKIITEYRNYYLPLQFPAILLSGDYWKISDVPSGRLHFHNCLEIGVCHSDSGTLEFYGNPLPFKEGDVTCIPRNIPHTTYSTRGDGESLVLPVPGPGGTVPQPPAQFLDELRFIFSVRPNL